MLQNSLINRNSPQSVQAPERKKWWKSIIFIAWVLGGYAAANVVVITVLVSLGEINIPIAAVNANVLNATAAALIYSLTILIVIGVPVIIKRLRVSRSEMGLTRLPNWMDILISPAGYIVYALLSTGLIAGLTALVATFNPEQVQQVGFEQLSQRYEYILAFVTLVILAPIAEEILFRGYLFGAIRRYVPVWVSIIITSLVFGLLHLQFSDSGATWNVVIDTVSLSIILCILRLTTKSLAAPILVHMIKNAIAFYLLFINPGLI